GDDADVVEPFAGDDGFDVGPMVGGVAMRVLLCIFGGSVDDVLGGGRRAGLRKRSCDGRRLRGFGGPLFLRARRRDAFDAWRLVWSALLCARQGRRWCCGRRDW